MGGEFISPNWHVILIHYPIALLTMGLLIEVLTLFWKRIDLRMAGRWMILIGSLLLILAATAGIYAFRDALQPTVAQVYPTPWHEVAEASSWSGAEWHFIDRHIWLNGVATGLIVLVVMSWVFASERWRQKLYWPALVCLFLGVGLIGAGAWYGGEAVYHYGTAVNPQAFQPSGPEAEKEVTFGYFFPPLQLHITLAGLFIAVTLLSLVLAFRRSSKSATESREQVSSPTHPVWNEQSFSGRFWVAVAVLAFLTAIFGLLGSTRVLSIEAIGSQFTMIFGNSRLLFHGLLGIGLLVLPIVLALTTRFQKNLWGAICGIALPIVMVLQVWLGIVLLFDGPQGPLLTISAPSLSSQEKASSNEEDDSQRDGKEKDKKTKKDQKSQPTVVIGMTDSLDYDPVKVTINAGETVLWKNTSAIPHTVTADPKLVKNQANVELPEGAKTFNSGNMLVEETFRHTFEVPGYYKYFCIPHEEFGMIGEIEVKPATE